MQLGFGFSRWLRSFPPQMLDLTGKGILECFDAFTGDGRNGIELKFFLFAEASQLLELVFGFSAHGFFRCGALRAYVR